MVTISTVTVFSLNLCHRILFKNTRPSSFNLILRILCGHFLSAVPSTFHSDNLVSYPINVHLICPIFFSHFPFIAKFLKPNGTHTNKAFPLENCVRKVLTLKRFAVLLLLLLTWPLPDWNMFHSDSQSHR